MVERCRASQRYVGDMCRAVGMCRSSLCSADQAAMRSLASVSSKASSVVNLSSMT